MIVALAGRRIDAPNAESPRFPLKNVELVRARLHKLFSEKDVGALVCSAACGADLLALSVAGELGIRRRLVLPFERERFRKTSVIDRPGNWGPMFDTICDEVAERGDLLILDFSGDEESSYAAATERIFDEAIRLQTSGEGNEKVLVVIVWEGAARKDHDATDETAELAKKAESRGFDVEKVLTK